jgi:hypothetical protein
MPAGIANDDTPSDRRRSAQLDASIAFPLLVQQRLSHLVDRRLYHPSLDALPRCHLSLTKKLCKKTRRVFDCGMMGSGCQIHFPSTAMTGEVICIRGEQGSKKWLLDSARRKTTYNTTKTNISDPATSRWIRSGSSRSRLSNVSEIFDLDLHRYNSQSYIQPRQNSLVLDVFQASRLAYIYRLSCPGKDRLAPCRSRLRKCDQYWILSRIERTPRHYFDVSSVDPARLAWVRRRTTTVVATPVSCRSIIHPGSAMIRNKSPSRQVAKSGIGGSQQGSHCPAWHHERCTARTG